MSFWRLQSFVEKLKTGSLIIQLQSHRVNDITSGRSLPQCCMAKVRTKPEEERQHQGHFEDSRLFENLLKYDLRRLMANPNLRCQPANAMVAALRPISDGICISNIATDMADVMLSTAAELAPRSERPRGAQGWCAGPGVEAETNAEWQQREARRHLRAEPHNNNFQKAVTMAGKNLRKVRKAGCSSDKMPSS